jgi:Asp-tRNA(Asn)/Glu-tRNA(Gln) amidotransferase A subunit family amidase
MRSRRTSKSRRTFRKSFQPSSPAPRRLAVDADKEIRAGRYRGSLHGIPYGIKDQFAVKRRAHDPVEMPQQQLNALR